LVPELLREMPRLIYLPLLRLPGQWRKSSSTDSSLVVGQRGREGLTITDWVSNECIVSSFDRMNREFAWVNRAYEPTRNVYNALMKNHREKQTPKGQALVTPRHDRT